MAKTRLNPGVKFPLGKIVATPNFLERAVEHGANPADFLSRFIRGDWGEVGAADAAQNEASLLNGTRLMGVYKFPSSEEEFWIITEADRSVTTLLMGSDY